MTDCDPVTLPASGSPRTAGTPQTPPAPAASVQAVIFDVDGTLVDSERDGHRVAFNEAFTAAGLPYHWDVEGYGELLTVTGGRRRIAGFLTGRGHPPEEADSLAAQLHSDKTRRFVTLVRDGAVAPRPGATRLVAELRAAGIRVAVATTGTRDWVLPLLDHAFGEDAFELVLTGSDVPLLKPDPAVYLAALSALGLDPDDGCAVEDSANGVTAARRAGLACLAVTNDYTAGQDFHGAGAVVDGFGPTPPARQVGGVGLPLPAGSVTAQTLAAVSVVR